VSEVKPNIKKEKGVSPRSREIRRALLKQKGGHLELKKKGKGSGGGDRGKKAVSKTFHGSVLKLSRRNQGDT